MEIVIEQKRGQLTDRIKEKSKELLGYEINVTELRLIPYIQYTLVNSQKLNPHHINLDDQKILSKWVSMGFITDGVTKQKGRPIQSEVAKLKVTKEFWDAMVEIIYLGYVQLF